jgi:hypothetical protein
MEALIERIITLKKKMPTMSGVLDYLLEWLGA